MAFKGFLQPPVQKQGVSMPNGIMLLGVNYSLPCLAGCSVGKT